MKKNKENILYGKSLREIRKKNNLTQEEVSQLTGLETKYISQIECGNAKGTINTMIKFCNAYSVTPNDILKKFVKNSTAQKELNIYNDKFIKLNKRDRNIVLSLIDALLNN